jgi:hypothetical protein
MISDAEKYRILVKSKATINYTQREGEDEPYCEVHGFVWVRRKTLDEALRVLAKYTDARQGGDKWRMQA